ncbi:MAG: Asp-tRNA(Asn)/Glu-tRNA(Gln) amidotransferase subunit GatB [Candidatus Vogelbacteria bacterium]|nr:Asp-tRNA(Asn)/Glu-tRNA(Gln) amidotransferase subunit GatB [Candidatus Vogelbacteria bacterium]
MEYKTTIGLEIHAELATKTKMFCPSLNYPDEKRPNVNVCPICMAHPGTLPTINKEAVKHVLRVGLALGGDLAMGFSEFDRKNYFYPDIPKGFQISQFKYPLVSGGKLNGIDVTRVHLEEDTAKSYHFDGKKDTYLDYNRAGLPLMELVTEPVIHNARQAGDFARELQLLLRYLGVSGANMERGQMRVEANISVSKTEQFGTKVEVKNLNSFKAVEHAIDYEVKRHIEVLEGGGEIIQETRGWDENSQKTFSQRAKENSHDYRYFPEPDLPKLKLNLVPEFQNLKATLPELPWERRERLLRFGITSEAAEIFVESVTIGNFFEKVTEKLSGKIELVKLASNYITSDLMSLMKDDQEKSLNVEDFVALLRMTDSGEVSSRGAKDILAVIVNDGGSPKKIAEDRGLFQKSDVTELKTICQEIVSENPTVAADYRGGKKASLQFLIGQGMKKSGGSANPKVLRDIFMELLQ